MDYTQTLEQLALSKFRLILPAFCCLLLDALILHFSQVHFPRGAFRILGSAQDKWKHLLHFSQRSSEPSLPHDLHGSLLTSILGQRQKRFFNLGSSQVDFGCYFKITYSSSASKMLSKLSSSSSNTFLGFLAGVFFSFGLQVGQNQSPLGTL